MQAQQILAKLKHQDIRAVNLWQLTTQKMLLSLCVCNSDMCKISEVSLAILNISSGSGQGPYCASSLKATIKVEAGFKV